MSYIGEKEVTRDGQQHGESVESGTEGIKVG